MSVVGHDVEKGAGDCPFQTVMVVLGNSASISARGHSAALMNQNLVI